MASILSCVSAITSALATTVCSTGVATTALGSLSLDDMVNILSNGAITTTEQEWPIDSVVQQAQAALCPLSVGILIIVGLVSFCVCRLV